VAIYTKVIDIEEELSPLVFEIPVPARTKSCLLCIKLDGCMGEMVDKAPVTKGMAVVWSGEV
jgi:hypothetical protein